MSERRAVSGSRSVGEARTVAASRTSAQPARLRGSDPPDRGGPDRRPGERIRRPRTGLEPGGERGHRHLWVQLAGAGAAVGCPGRRRRSSGPSTPRRARRRPRRRAATSGPGCRRRSSSCRRPAAAGRRRSACGSRTIRSPCSSWHRRTMSWLLVRARRGADRRARPWCRRCAARSRGTPGGRSSSSGCRPMWRRRLRRCVGDTD